MRRMRVLMDYRETQSVRGFHLIAATKGAERALRSTSLWHLGGRRPDERLAVQALEFEIDLKLRRCSRTLLTFMPLFDLYVAIVDRMPKDQLFHRAVRSARHCLIGATFELLDAPKAVTLMPGLDTLAFGAEVASRLQSIALSET